MIRSQFIKLLASIHQELRSRAKITVPPRKVAVFSDKLKGVCSQRDKHLKKILKAGRSRWKRESGYYAQSEAENVIYRYKKFLVEESERRITKLRKMKLQLDVMF